MDKLLSVLVHAFALADEGKSIVHPQLTTFNFKPLIGGCEYFFQCARAFCRLVVIGITKEYPIFQIVKNANYQSDLPMKEDFE